MEQVNEILKLIDENIDGFIGGIDAYTELGINDKVFQVHIGNSDISFINGGPKGWMMKISKNNSEIEIQEFDKFRFQCVYDGLSKAYNQQEESRKKEVISGILNEIQSIFKKW